MHARKDRPNRVLSGEARSRTVWRGQAITVDCLTISKGNHAQVHHRRRLSPGPRNSDRCSRQRRRRDNGVGSVGKGDVQSALGWNNGDFDKKVGNAQVHCQRRRWSSLTTRCPASTARRGHRAEVAHDHLPARYDHGQGHAGADKAATASRSPASNLTPARDTAASPPPAAQTLRTVPCLVRLVHVHEPRTGRPVRQRTVTTTGGLKVNGIDLPNTPVVPAHRSPNPAPPHHQCSPACGRRGALCFGQTRRGTTARRLASSTAMVEYDIRELFF